MNANTALKINDAVDQAIRCGESLDEIFEQVRKAARQAFETKQQADREAFQRRIEQARL